MSKAVQGKLVPVCLICKQVPAAGLYDGIYIRHHFICRSCEQLVCQSHRGEERYDDIAVRLRRIFR